MNANKEKISEQVIGCAMAVSNGLGNGFLESVYSNALACEMRLHDIRYQQEHPLPVFYKELQVGWFKADFVVEDVLVLELKAVRQLTNEHSAQLLNYLKAGQKQAGLLLNFGTPRLGIKRLVANHQDDVPI